MELTAKIVQIVAPITGMGKNGEWKKQNVILETDGMYPKKVCVTLWGDKVGDPVLQEGAMVTVSFDAESREYNGNWYTDLRAWRIVPADASGAPVAAAGQGQSAPTPPPVNFGAESEDDLPF